MRYLLLIFIWPVVFNGYPQVPKTTLLSAIVVDNDSIPVPGVAVINTRTLKMVRTDSTGFFQTEIAGNDSVFLYHIAFKRRFVNENDNGKILRLEPQINEIQQVDVIDNAVQEMKNLQQNLEDIKGLILVKKFTDSDFTESLRISGSVQQNGSHDKGFKPFFGPTLHLPIGKIAELVGGNENKHQRRKLTSHYHLVKKKDNDKEK